MSPDIEDKIADLESRLAFQDDLLNAMNARVAEQDRELAMLQLQLRHLNDKIKQFQDTAPSSDNPHTELPPHY